MMGTEDRLVYMANQIARNLQTMGIDRAIAATADHIATFWDPRMRGLISARSERPDSGLGEIAGRAIALLRDTGAPSTQTPATAFAGVAEPGMSDAG